MKRSYAVIVFTVTFFCLVLLIPTESMCWSPFSGGGGGTARTTIFTPAAGISATNVQAALEELAVSVNTSGTGDVTKVGDCIAGDCLDGSSDGGTYIRLYDGNSHYSALTAGDSTANLSFKLPTGYPAADGYIVLMSSTGVFSTQVATTYESHTSNDIDVDRFASDTTDDNLIDAAIINWISPSGISLVDSSPDGSGEMGYAANVFTLFANSEDLTLTAGSDLWTFNSSTGATFAFTPALAPTILNLPSSNASPGTTAGQIRHDSTVTGLTTGALAWYDGDEIRYVVDLDVLPSDNGYYVQYNSSDGKFVMAAGGVSDGDKTDITVSNSGATWNIDSGAVTTTEILDNTISATDLAATLTMGSADLIDLSAVVTTTGVDAGLVVPTYANYAPASAKAFITYDADNNALMVYETGGWVNASAGSGAATSLNFLTTQAEGSLSTESVMTEGLAIDFTDAGGDGGAFTVAFDPTELTGDRTWAAGGAATIAWTFNVSTGTDPVITAGNNYINVSTGALQVGGAAVYSVGGTDVALADGGTGVSLSDPNADRVMFWDDSESAVAFLTLDTNHFSYSAATLSIGTDTIDDTLIDWGTGAAQVSMDDVPDGSSYQKVAAADVDASNHVNLIQDSDGTGAFQFTGSASATRAITLVDADQTLMNLGSAQNVSGDKEIQDNVALSFGNDNDWEVTYDETTSDALEFTHTAGAGADVTFDLNDNAAASTFSIINSDGTYAANLSVDGNITTAGTITSTATGDSYIELATQSALTASGNRLYFIGNELTVSENSEADLVLTDGDSATLTGTSWDFSAVTNFEIPNSAAPTTDAFGEIAADNNAWATSRGALQVYDGTANTWVVATLSSDTPSNGQIPKWNTGGTVTWEDDLNAGSPSINSVTDATADAAIAFDINEEIAWNYTGDFTTGSQFLIEQKTGNPSGGVLFEVKGADSSPVLASFGDGTNKINISNTGALTLAGTASITGGDDNVVAGGITFDSTPGASGDLGYASNAFTGYANSEDFSLTASSNLWTFSSGSSAVFAFTPAVTLTAGGTVSTTSSLYFRDTALSIASANDGHLDLTADTSIDLNGYVVTTSSMGIGSHLTVTGNILPGAADTYNVGSATAEVANLYLGDSANVYFQNDQSVYLTSSAGTLTLTGAMVASSFTAARAAGSAAQYIELYEAYDSAGDESIKLQAQDMAADLTFTLPAAYPATTGLILTCTSTGVMSWVADATAEGEGSGTMTTVKEADSGVGGADIVTLDFGAGFDLAESPDTEIQVSLDLTEYSGAAIGSTSGEITNIYMGDAAVIYGQADQSNYLTSSATGWATSLDLEVTGGDLTLAAAGVKLTGDGDGALVILGLGDGADEDLNINLDDTANTAFFSSSTGVTDYAFDGNITGLVKPVILTHASGVHDGSNDQATLTDSGESFTTNSMVGMTIYNITDGSSGTVTANNGTTITATLSGGTQNDWDTNDVWQVGPGPKQSGSCFYVGAASTIRHPATAGYVAEYYATAAAAITVDVASASMVITNATASAVDAGDSIDSPATAGSFICLHNASATLAYAQGKSGTWTDGGAD